MLRVWAEWTHIAGQPMHQTMSDHLVLPLEDFTPPLRGQLSTGQ